MSKSCNVFVSVTPVIGCTQLPLLPKVFVFLIKCNFCGFADDLYNLNELSLSSVSLLSSLVKLERFTITLIVWMQLFNLALRLADS